MIDTCVNSFITQDYDEKFFFGEKFFVSGYMTFQPEELDIILGDKFILADVRKYNRSSVECKQE